MPFPPKPALKPLLIYDGDCHFCKRWIERWKTLTGDAVDYAPSPKPITAVQLTEPDGQTLEGAQAVFKSLDYGGKGAGLWFYDNFPWFAEASEIFYGLVARHRNFFSKLTDIFWGKNLQPPTYVTSSWLFMRALGIINLIAFISLGSQIEGLIGSGGILPLTPFLDAVRNQYGSQSYNLLPTLFWFNSGDAAILLACKAGIVLSILLILDLAPWIVPAVLWALYLSLSLAARDFLSFQWDILLLEINFLAIFLNAPRLWPRFWNPSGPSCAALWILRLALFKLMLQSGLVKLLSGDATWKNLTALTFHYETQPIPNAVSWFAHHLPAWFHKISNAGMFGIEIFVPFLIFLPRRAKIAAFAALAAFQLLIFLTGNYCFFNLLALALCLLLLDDQAIGRFLPKQKVIFSSEKAASWLEKSRKAVLVPAAILLIFLNCVQITGTFYRRNYPEWMIRVIQTASAWRTVNSYGLFAVMTLSRPEIIIEGSSDGQNWQEYEFKWKPGDLSRRPPFVAPHQPRVDWQMWFAALGNVRQNPWFVNLLVRLMDGSPAVAALLEKNPFPAAPPMAVRARVYNYRFTTSEERKSTGNWWKRELAGDYCPPISLRREK